jgi:hypothetical protein
MFSSRFWLMVRSLPVHGALCIIGSLTYCGALAIDGSLVTIGALFVYWLTQ